MKDFYVEFNQSVYYALLTVRVDFHNNENPKLIKEKAKEMYLEKVLHGEFYENGEIEENPSILTPKKAFVKFLDATEKEKKTLEETYEDFKKITNEVLLFDASLV